MQALPLLPADTLVVSDGLGDPAGIFCLLQAHAAKTLGPQGEAAFMVLELAAQVKFGLLLPADPAPAGRGVGDGPGPAAGRGRRPAPKPAAVLFCVPEDPALLAPVLQRLGETGP